MKHLLFRADGSSEVGLGHLYRMFALLELFKDTFSCTLITSSKTSADVIPAAYTCARIPAHVPLEEEPAWLAEHYPSENFRIIADGYGFTASYQKVLKALNYHLTYIDDLFREHMYADIVINHALTARASDYHAEPYTRFALGTSYAILRPAFLEAAKIGRSVEQISTAFVCFGGADPFDLTLKATQALLAFPDIKIIHIVTGAAYTHQAVLSLDPSGSRVRIHRNLSEQELITVMKSCDFAIASASTILYELCSVKMPVLAGYYVENQKNLYQGCLDNKLIFEGGNLEHSRVQDFEKSIEKVLRETDYSQQLQAQSHFFDAHIKERFLDLFAEISYRKVSANDMLLVYEWANDKLSRENSYFTEPIALETHKGWYERKIVDPSALIYIAEVNGIPAGMVRYEVAQDHAVVGVSVAESFRGKGLAPEFLRATATLYFEYRHLPVHAFIKKQNQASVRSFEKAGYKKLREELVHGADSFVYKLEKHDVQ